MEVFIIAAVTTDGFIGRDQDDRSFDWTSSEDTRCYIDMIKKADVIVMGTRTFKSVKRHPKNSHYIIYTRSPAGFINPRPEVITAEATDDSPNILLERLAKEGKKKIAICGGSSIYSLFMKSGLVQKIYLTTEPIVFGQGIKLFADKIEANLELVSQKPLNKNGTILSEYKVKHVES